MGDVRLTVLVSGRVQGVGFREWTRRTAERIGLSGSATNLPDGRVEVVAEGPRAQCERLLAAVQGDETPGQVEGVDVTWGDATGAAGFRSR